MTASTAWAATCEGCGGGPRSHPAASTHTLIVVPTAAPAGAGTWPVRRTPRWTSSAAATNRSARR